MKKNKIIIQKSYISKVAEMRHYKKYRYKYI